MTPKTLFITLVVLLVGQLLPQELYAWCPTVAGWLLRLAARLVPAPHRARYEQEWLAGLEAWEGRNLAALGHALCVLAFAPSLWVRLRGSQSATDRRRSGRRRRMPHPGLPPTTYRLVALLAALTVMLLAAWLMVDLGGSDLSAMVDHATQAAAALCAGVACFYASRREPSGLGEAWTQALRRGWRLIGAAAIVWGVAKLALTYYVQVLAQQPFSQADVGYLAAIPLLVTGMLAFPIAVGHPAARIRTLLDALLIAGSLLAVSWVTTIGPVLQRLGPAASLSQRVVELAQPIFDILVATVALSLLARTRRREPAPTTMLALALLALAVASSGHTHLLATGRYGTHQLIDIGLVVGWLLILVATVRPITLRQDWRGEHRLLARTTLPYALLALALLTLITVKQLSASHELDRFLVIDSVVLAALAFVRLLATLIASRRPNRRLERMVEELSEREAQLERALIAEQQAAEDLRSRIRELEAGHGGQAV
jgi:two-component system, sensor histidine kinase and response regulator